MAMAIPIMMIAGGALAAAGSLKQAQAQQAASEYNAAISERNAITVRAQADSDAAAFRQQMTLREGSLIAGYGASGVTGDGSPLDVLGMSAANAKRDELMIQYKSDLAAMGYRETAVLNRMQGGQAIEAGNYQAASSLLTGVSGGVANYTAATRGYGTPISPAMQGPN